MGSDGGEQVLEVEKGVARREELKRAARWYGQDKTRRKGR